MTRYRSPQRGFTMLEVLVALLILMIGLLGLAGLLVTTQQGEVEAYQRKQAAVLLQDMVDRLLANAIALVDDLRAQLALALFELSPQALQRALRHRLAPYAVFRWRGVARPSGDA